MREELRFNLRIFLSQDDVGEKYTMLIQKMPDKDDGQVVKDTVEMNMLQTG